jgi:hypothetical protein
MPKQRGTTRYRPTESKYKGGAKELYVTYDLEQQTRGGGTAVYPKVKRVYVAGDVNGWEVGDFAKKSGRQAHGVKVTYTQSRSGYQRRAFTAHRGQTTYQVRPAAVEPTTQAFSQVIEVPERARNVGFHAGTLPARYREALQSVR